jgi:hypothetical protein
VKVLFLLATAVGLAAQGHAQDHPQFVWQGDVDGTAILHLSGKSLKVQIPDGAPVGRQKFHFSDALPGSQQKVRLDVLEGRGYVHVLDQPGIENHYALAVEIEDRQQGSSHYSIALYWDTSDNVREEHAGKTQRMTWSGHVDEGTVISCKGRVCASSAIVSDEHFQFSKPLPDREIDVRLEDPVGRGQIHLIEQPRKENNYTARVSIRDPLPGAGEYSFTLAWSGTTKETAGDSGPIAEPVGRGFLWSGRVDGRVRVTLQGGASLTEVVAGAPVQGQHAEMLRSLPTRSDLMPAIQKLRGRGRVSIIEQPSDKNNYRLIFEIDDPDPGADDYEIELDW